MARAEDEFKKRFTNQELSNEGFDSEELWGAISDELDQPPPSNNNTKNFLWLFFLGMIIIGIGIFSIQHQIPDQPSIAKHTVENQDATESAISKNSIETPNPKQPSISTNTKERLNTTLSSDSKRSGNKKEDKNELKASVFPSKKLDFHTIPKRNTEKSFHSKNKPTKDFAPNQFSSTKMNISKPLSFIANNSTKQNPIVTSFNIIKKDNSSSKNRIAPSQNKILLEDKQQLPTVNRPEIIDNEDVLLPNSLKKEIDVTALPTKLSSVVFDSSLELEQLKSKKKAATGKNKKLEVELGLWGGANSLMLNFNSNSLTDLAQAKTQAASSQLGSSLGLNSSLIWNDRFLFSTGLDYHQLWSKFEYRNSDSIQIIKENQLLTVWIDQPSGDTLKSVYGDATVDGVSTRHVVHYNKYQQVSIPIEIGFQESTQNFVYGIKAGGSFNFALNQSGRTLSANAEIVEFDNNHSARLFKLFTIGLRVSPFLGYRITENLTLKMLPKWNWMTNTKFDGTDIKSNGHQFNLNFGIGYAFGKGM